MQTGWNSISCIILFEAYCGHLKFRKQWSNDRKQLHVGKCNRFEFRKEHSTGTQPVTKTIKSENRTWCGGVALQKTANEFINYAGQSGFISKMKMATSTAAKCEYGYYGIRTDEMLYLHDSRIKDSLPCFCLFAKHKLYLKGYIIRPFI